MKKRLLAGVIAVMMVVLTACENDGPEPTPTVAMGRYMEETLAFPGTLSNILYFEVMDDVVWLAANMSGGEFAYDNRSFHVWYSEDFGNTWQLRNYDFYDQLAGLPVSVYMVSPEELYILSSIEGDVVAGDGGAVLQAEFFLYHYTTADGLTELDATVMTEAYSQAQRKEIRLSEAGDLILGTTEDYIQMQGTEARIKRTIPQAWSRFGATALWGDTIAGFNAGQITCYSLETGDVIATIPVDIATNTVLTPSVDGESLFYMNADGIYHAFLDGAATERILDGELYAINLPTLNPRHLVMNSEGSFLTVLTATSHYAIYRYVYDPQIPAVPSREIRVYSLRENSSVRQAIGTFHQADPDVKAVLEIGVPSGSGVNPSDALRTLSTELLTGRGPDVLVLDGMPMASYIEQGVLHDLSQLFDGTADGEQFIPAIADTYRRDGKLYAIPARFSTLMMQGIDVNAVTDIAGLADWLETQDNKAIGLVKPNLMSRFYAALSPGWFLPDGSLDVAQFTADLTQLGRIAHMLPDVPDDAISYYESGNSPQRGALLLKGEATRVTFGTLTYFLPYAPANQVYQDGVADPPRPFPAGGVFEPRSVLGINAASGDMAMAEAFVRTALSFEILMVTTEDGFPVRRDALIASSGSPMPVETAYSSTTVYNARLDAQETVLLHFSWPSDAVIDALIETLCSLSVAAHTDLIVQQMIYEETAPFIAGERSLEETVTGLVNKLSIYLSQ